MSDGDFSIHSQSCDVEQAFSRIGIDADISNISFIFDTCCRYKSDDSGEAVFVEEAVGLGEGLVESG
jgi:hypothetical protein